MIFQKIKIRIKFAFFRASKLGTKEISISPALNNDVTSAVRSMRSSKRNKEIQEKSKEFHLLF